MFKKIMLALSVLLMTINFAFAMVDVNQADQAALDGVKGIGPAMSKKILDERKKGGNFKDWADFEKRVSGVGEKKAVKLSEAGLTVGGQAKPNAPAAAKKEMAAAKAPAKEMKAAAKEAKVEAKEIKADIKK